MNGLVVVGSINVDLSIQAARHPKGGETLPGEGFAVRCGGKGANQAIAAARFGATVYMIGCVGADENGERARGNLRGAGIETDGLTTSNKAPTGVALITTAQGENTIVIDSGANYELTPTVLEGQAHMLSTAQAVLVQNEVPMETVEATARLCIKHGVPCILNPAPAFALSENTIASVAYITPNEHECAIAFGCDMEQALRNNPNKLIVTLGSEGVRTWVRSDDDEREIHLAAHEVDVVDSTGAGDAFNGAFAACVVQSYTLEDALVYANAAAALSITCHGAQTAPSYQDVRSFLM